MKLFNEVITEFSGEVVEILVRDGDLVEVGKPIMYVRPGGDL
jgi:acetyl-CoA carboxylase biotin carboxyl carrier protein